MSSEKVSQETRDAFRHRASESGQDRATVRDMAAVGKATRADADTERVHAFLARKLARGGPEAIQGLANDLQPVAFLAEGAAVRRAVCKVIIDTDASHLEGTGFLVTPRVLITNQHVIRDEDAAQRAVVIFDYELDENGARRAETRFRLDPNGLALFSPEVGGLDYALVALGDRIEGSGSAADLGYCPLSNTPDRHIVGMNVNVIQHPEGGHKQVAVRNNLLTHRTETTLLYETDTKVGSSGSPVFNDDWDVVALHHYGEPFAERTDEEGKPLPQSVNEGIRISSIYNDLDRQAATLEEPKRALVRDVLSLAVTAPQGTLLPQLTKRPPEPSHERAVRTEDDTMSRDTDASAVQLSIPITSSPVEVSIRIGGVPGGTRADVKRGAAQLRPASEGKRLDRDYSNRNGFDEGFITGLPIKLTKIGKPLVSHIAPVADGTKSGVLAYQNFSVVMNKERDLALLTATNIDGDSYMRVNRKTGKVEGAEGETWYKDRRISDEYYVGQDFYSDWSHKFDRGHLTRRNDPTWGTDEEAERANADTFHFTNCAPQHFRFNQSTEFWQGIERYVLEQGILKPGRANRLTVLQGPVFDRDDPWAGGVQVPAQFWKIVIWNGAKGKRAVGMLANQSDLFDEDRAFVPRPDEDRSVEVRQFHVAIRQIAAVTKLDLSDIEKFDTFAKGLPGAGEAVSRITKWSDIAL